MLRNWLIERPLAVDDLVELFNIKYLQSNYLPVYLISATATSKYSGTRTDAIYPEHHQPNVDYEGGSGDDDTTRNNDEIQYHTNPVSGKVAVTFDKEMILAIQHTLTPMLLNILQFDWENMKQLSEGEIGNFIQYTLNDHDVLQYFTNLVFDKLYEKATEKEGSNSKLDLHKPLHKVKEIIRVYVPIWEGTYTYKNKEYPFLINGESGMIEGEYKMSLLQNLLPLIICLIFLTGFGSLLYIIY